MIRPAKLYGFTECAYYFHLSCAGVGDKAQWTFDFSPADEDNPPIFSFVFWAEDPTASPDVQTGFVPFELADHPGYSDVGETLAGYAASIDDPPGVDGMGGGWAESAFLIVQQMNGGFATATVTAIPYDATALTVGDPVTCDLAPYIGCLGVLLGSVVNMFGGGNFPDPTGDTSTPNRVWFWFVSSTDAQPGCIVEPGGGGSGVGSIIDDGSVGTVVLNDGETRYCSSDHTDVGACFTDREGCSVHVADADTADTLTITGPITLTPDPTTAGYYYIDLDTIGLYDLGASTPISGVFEGNVTTDLGTARVRAAFSFNL